MIVKIKTNECPINIIADNPHLFNGKLVKVEREMMEKLISEAKSIAENNVVVKNELNGQKGVTKYFVVIPGEIETKLTFIEKYNYNSNKNNYSYYLTSVVADDIKNCTLNSDFWLDRHGNENIIVFEYSKISVADCGSCQNLS